MILTRDKGQRMWGNPGGGSGGTGGGGGNSGVSAAWVEQNYLSKEFFSQIFKIKATVTETVEGVTTTREIDLLPNAIADGTNTTLKNVKVEAGLWTEQFLSALGLNGGGGGGGATTLGELSDVVITNPQNGQALIYNSGTGMWVNGAGGGGGGGGSVTSVGMTVPTGFAISGSPITASGTLALSFATGYSLPLTADVNKGVTAYGWGNHANAGYLTSVSFSDLTSHPTTLSGYGITDAYTKTEADAKYMTIAAFENLFNALNSSGNKVSHPYSSGVASIKALVGLWTEQYLSALGQNSGGGGGVTLNEPLASINSAGLGAPSQSGVAIMWNGTAWTYQVPGGGGGGGGTVTSVGMSVPTGFAVSGSPVTGSGTLALSFATGYSLPLTADVNKGVAAYGWGNHANAGYASSQSVSTLQGYFDSNGNAKSALKLTTVSKTAWGKTYWTANGVPDNVEGNISAGNSGGVIEKFHAIELNNAGSLSSYGGLMDFHYNGSAADYTTRMIEEAAGVVSIYGKNSASPYADKLAGVKVGSNVTGASYVQIGTVRLVYDHTNTALKVEKQDGTAANLYATGGVSALGMMATDSGMLENLNLTGRLKFIDVENEYEQQIYGDTDGYLHINASEGIELNSDLDLNGYTLYMTGGNIDANYVSCKRFYLGSTRYLYLDANNVLKYYDNGTVRTIAFA